MKPLKLLSIINIILIIFFGYDCNNMFAAQPVDYTSYVNPLIGTGGHGHVFVGASVPHGMVQLGPNNLSKGWNWCSGYHDSDSTIIGFAHTHLSGTGIADLGDILFMPLTGDLSKEYVSTFRKQNQIVTPSYYSVLLDRYNIKVELTATKRVGFHRYTYPKDVNISILINLDEGVKSLDSRNGTIETFFKLINDSTVSGYRISDEWATNHKVYFTSVFSRSIISADIYNEGIIKTSSATKGKDIKVLLKFINNGSPLHVKTGISYVSEEGAAKNIDSELPHWNFNQAQRDAKGKWNETLSKIKFDSFDSSAKEIFYTSLYHTQIAPSIFSDADGKYRGADNKIYIAKDFIPYTVFSLWDTYRAVHPLYTLIDNNVPNYVNSLLAIYDQQNNLPIWHLVGNETNCMVGVHSIPVIVDACLKDFKGIDKERAYRAVSSIEKMDVNGLNYVRTQEYIPADKVSWSVARALEYAVDDYSVAQMAKFLEKTDDYNKFIIRSKYYKHYFDSSLGFMRGKLADGTWRKDFSPSHSIHMEDDYVEGNAWQYTWLVPHDPEGLIELFGGKTRFTAKLDSLFEANSELNKGASIDISGMIGQYAHGNEPSHHILYLYSYVNKQWKTAKLVRKVFTNFYKPEIDGLIGNEDCGQMSAWYIFSALGFYPVNPVDGTFVFGSPLANKAIIKLNNGKTFEIYAEGNNSNNKYIQSIKLNGENYNKPYITYKQIMKGGNIHLVMGKNPNLAFGITNNKITLIKY